MDYLFKKIHSLFSCYFFIINIFFQKIDADFYNNLKNKNKILFVSGFYILDPYKTESNLSKFNFVKKIIAVLFYLWIIFLTFHQVLDLNYIDFPRVKYLFYLICNFKFFLFILNVGLFFIINSIWLGFFRRHSYSN